MCGSDDVTLRVFGVMMGLNWIWLYFSEEESIYALLTAGT